VISTAEVDLPYRKTARYTGQTKINFMKCSCQPFDTRNAQEVFAGTQKNKNGRMKKWSFVLLLISLSLFFFSCQKELSNESGNAGNIDSQWEFTEGSTVFKGGIDTAYIEPSGGFQSLVFEGTSNEGNGHIYLQIFGSSITGTSYKNPNVFFEYVENASILYTNVPTNIDAFTVVVTNIDATSVTGTFSGEVEDSAGVKKTITNGTFKASLKSVTTPPEQGLCKIQNIGFLDLSSGIGFASLTNTFNSSNKISRVQFIDSAGQTPGEDFTLTYTANRISIDANQYFDLDASGRIMQFNGYIDADADGGYPQVIINYSYDANGYMSKATYALPAAPAAVFQEINYTWTNGNLTRVVVAPPGSQERIELLYEYDMTKAPKEFMCFFPNYEVVYLQSAINYGKNSTNLPIKSTALTYGATGAEEDKAESVFTSFGIIDNYVRSFEIVGEGSILPGDTRYVLNYKCF
jgi:hypothetical protein